MLGFRTLPAMRMVACGDREERAGALGERVDGLGHRVGSVGGASTEAQADDPRALGGGPLHARDDPGVGAEPAVVEDLADQEAGIRGGTLVLACRCLATAGDDRRDVGSVAVAVLGGAALGEVLGGDHGVGEIGVRGVDPGVEHGDLHAGTGVAGGPGFRCADLRDTLVEGGAHLSVQPDLLDARVERGTGRGAAAWPRGELAPEPVGLAHWHADGGTVDARQVGRDPGAGGVDGRTQVGSGGSAFPVGHDQREGLAGSIRVPLLDQGRDVEQPAVQPPSGDQPLSVGWYDREVAASADALDEGQLTTTRRRSDVHTPPAPDVGRNDHLVAGDQRDCRLGPTRRGWRRARTTPRSRRPDRPPGGARRSTRCCHRCGDRDREHRPRQPSPSSGSHPAPFVESRRARVRLVHPPHMCPQTTEWFPSAKNLLGTARTTAEDPGSGRAKG